MNWDYKHSLSIQIERQRWNISCALWRWKWFIFKDVAAYFHYFKVLLISMVLEMTDSRVQEKEAGIVIFLHTSEWEATPRICCLCCGSEPWVLFMAGCTMPAVLFLMGELWFLTFSVSLHLPKGSTAPPQYHPCLSSPPPYRQRLSYLLHSQPGTSLSVSPAPLLTPAGMKNHPCSLDKDNPLLFPPLWGQL